MKTIALIFGILILENIYAQTIIDSETGNQVVRIIKSTSKTISSTTAIIGYVESVVKTIKYNSLYNAFEDELSKAIIKYTNQYRVSHGLHSLIEIKEFNDAGKIHCQYLVWQSNKNNMYMLEHEETEKSNPYYRGYNPTDRVSNIFKTKVFCGENILYRFENLSYLNTENLKQLADSIGYNMVYKQWHNSPGHRKNMLDNEYKYIGSSSIIKRVCSNDKFHNNKGVIIKKNDEYEYEYEFLYGVQVFGFEFDTLKTSGIIENSGKDKLQDKRTALKKEKLENKKHTHFQKTFNKRKKKLLKSVKLFLNKLF